MERHSVFDRLRRTVIGSPLPTSASHEERYSNAEALAILSSDALSSVAYATQEIVLTLGMAGAAALSFTLPITGLIVLLMLIVGTSYRQDHQGLPPRRRLLPGFPGEHRPLGGPDRRSLPVY